MHKLAYINDNPFAIQEGETMLAFIQRHRGRSYVPTLCDAPNLTPFGSCRLCSVATIGPGSDKTRIVGACHNQISEGLHIYTHTEALERLRRNIVELILTDHPLDCLTCEANGHCELQKVAAQVGIREQRYAPGRNHLSQPKDKSHPYLVSDLSKCINCFRCVRACDEVQGQFVLSMAGRGFDSHIIKGMDASFADSDCVSCGACVQACPTAAISDIFQLNRTQATDKVRTVCTYCGVGCNLEVAVRDNAIVNISAPYDAEVNQGHTCVKGRYAFRFYDHPDRLRTPLIRRKGKLEPATWDETFDYIATRLQQIKTKYGPDAIAGISSSRCTNEENYLMQKFIRAVIGTNNIDGCARVCHAPTALGMQRTLGTGAATNSIDDLQHTDCILVIGANATVAHPVTGAKIKQEAMKGKTLIVVDPRRTELAQYAQYHLQLRPGANVALLNMMLYYTMKEGWEDRSFIERRLEGYEQLKKHVLALDIGELEAVCGVKRQLVRDATQAYATANASMCFHGLGVTEHYQGTFGVMLIADLAMITGNIGRRGVGINPLRGQNNVQGAADMGVQPHQGPGYFDIRNAEARETCETQWGVSIPAVPGYTIPEMFESAISGKLKALWIMGEDVVQTEPNTAKVKEALKSLDFFIVQELFYSETADYADVVLPASSFFEKSGTFTNGERRVQRVNRVIPPLPGTMPDGEIMVAIMNRMGYAQPVYDPAGLLQEISAVVPFFKGITWERLGKNGLQWPVSEDGIDTKILHAESFKSGKGKLAVVDFEESPELIRHKTRFPLILTTNRNLEHYNSGSMTRRTSDTLLAGEDILLIHPSDAEARGIKGGDRVQLQSARGMTTLRTKVTTKVPPGVISSSFHFPEGKVNLVIGEGMDTEASCPEYKVVAVEVAKVG